MKFQLASCMVQLNIHQHVQKQSITPPELAILRMMHVQNRQDNPVADSSIKLLRNIVTVVDKETGKKTKADKGERVYETSPLLEIQRLRSKYGKNAATKRYWLDEIYPGCAQNPTLLPTTFEQVKWLPAEVASSHDAPSRMLLPGEPGFEEPVEATDETPVKWVPPVSEPVEPTAPEGAAPGDGGLENIAKEAVEEMATD